MCNAANVSNDGTVQIEVIRTFVSIREPRHPAAQTRSRSAPPTARFGCNNPAYPIELPSCDNSPTSFSEGNSPKQNKQIRKQCTTIMVRNLPNRTKLGRVQQHLVSLGFEKFDSVYMPVDTRTGMNKGYAFVHFGDVKMARQFCEKVEGTQLPGSQSCKLLAAAEASYQGAAVKPKKVGHDQHTARNFSARVWVK